MDPLIGTIQLFGFNFAPQGWAFCQGQLLPINQYTALFSLLGTTYGGDGRSTFGLPDLRSRIPVGMGQGTGLSNYNWGQTGGTENTTLNTNQLPAHTHQMTGSSDPQAAGSPAGNALGSTGRGTGTNIYASGAGTPVSMASATGATGGNQPFSNIQPYLALNYCIALVGVFPSRS